MPKDWRDDYRYDAHGRIAGWTRTRGDKTESFTADGLLDLERDEKERALKAEAVRYAPKREDAQTPPVIEQISTGNIFVYEYASDEDMIGRIVGRSSGDEAVDPAPSGAHGDES